MAPDARSCPCCGNNLTCLSVAGTMKSLKKDGFVTAHDIALRKGYDDLIPILKPKPHHIIPSNSLEKLEKNVHNLMQGLARDKVSNPTIFHPITQETTTHATTQILKHAIRLPQLSVMTEMNTSTPSLWIPIPTMYGVSPPHPDTPNSHPTLLTKSPPPTKPLQNYRASFSTLTPRIPASQSR